MVLDSLPTLSISFRSSPVPYKLNSLHITLVAHFIVIRAGTRIERSGYALDRENCALRIYFWGDLDYAHNDAPGVDRAYNAATGSTVIGGNDHIPLAFPCNET